MQTKYLENICIPVAAWHTMYSKRKSRFCVNCSLMLRRCWHYIEQHWLAAAKQLIVNLPLTINSNNHTASTCTSVSVTNAQQ